MSCVIDLYPWRSAPQCLSHPAGVSLPLKDLGRAELLIPQLRHAISTGSYCADMIRALPSSLCPGGRVLVIGTGIGVLSTLAAKIPGVEKVVAMEPNVTVAGYIEEVHRMNGVPWVETVNAIPARGAQRRVPLFVRHDMRASSLVPDDGPWRQVMLVPGVDLGLILAEERIGLVVADRSIVSAEAWGQAQFGSAVRVLLGFPGSMDACCDRDALAAALAARTGAVENFGAALMFGGGQADQPEATRATSAR